MPQAWRDQRGIALAVAALIVLRFAMAAMLPLSFDEAYYWLWSKHLALSYYDHPPIIAYAIRIGTVFFGATCFGVRFVPLLFSAGASWAVWRSGAILLKSERGGAVSALFFNLTLMATVETMTATPDAPLMFAAALVIWALAKLQATGEGRWWLAVGAAGGLALLSKYTAAFLALGALSWLAFTREGRRWALTPWPWAGMALALVLFVPVIWWNAAHDWISFRFQFSKAGGGHFAPQYLAEFLAGQIAMASPFIFILGAVGLWRRHSLLLTALFVPSVLFFAEHALHARVQGNWPSFLYPGLAIAASGAMLQADPAGWAGRLMRVSKRWAVPAALLILGISYGQALSGFLPMRDPTAHLLASGFQPVADEIAALKAKTGAAGVVTTDYAPTGWLAFYLPKHIPVVQANQPYRWLAAPKAGAMLLREPLLYVSEPRRDRAKSLARDFRGIRLLTTLSRTRGGRVVARYHVWLLTGWRDRAVGRVTNAP
jgi:4-amino-4-deoxy-L-arabinose transferase-like glycosyltransferase